jgi:hypothetical protein
MGLPAYAAWLVEVLAVPLFLWQDPQPPRPLVVVLPEIVLVMLLVTAVMVLTQRILARTFEKRGKNTRMPGSTMVGEATLCRWDPVEATLFSAVLVLSGSLVMATAFFHSISHGLGLPPGSAQSLRRDIAGFIEQNSTLKIAGDPLEDWVKWDSSTSVSDYCRRMAVTGWGGGIELAACAHLKKINIHVYEHERAGEFKRVGCFDYPNATRVVHVLYQGGLHYDALVPHL